MKINNLNPEKYMRFFAFGCSFTNYKWLTWADIIGNDIAVYENWAQPSAGNHFIFNSFIEADTRYNFTKDDLIIIFWSTKEREDRYLNNQWIHDTAATIQDTYGTDWVKEFYLDSRSYLIRDLAYMKATQSLLESKECDWANLSWYEFFNNSTLREKFENTNNKDLLLTEWRDKSKQVYKTNTVPDFFDDQDVIKLYQDVFNNIDGVYKWFDAEYIKNRTAPDDDVHPTPREALMFLDWVWPNNTISDNSRQYAKEWNFKNSANRSKITRL